MGRKGWLGTLVGGAAAGAALIGAYVVAIRPRLLTWGATAEEAERTLPGDELVADAKMKATHAITIDAPAAEVWPWLVQIGHQRAGWYSYDSLHRLMGIAGSVENQERSAEHVIPELQALDVGDMIEIGPDMGYKVVEIDPGRALVLHIAVEMGTFRSFDPAEETPNDFFASSWTWFLKELGENKTRLIVRIQMDYAPSALQALMVRGVIEPGSFVMERKTLLGIKRRVEASVSSGQGA